mmetsp:Transcript_3001/g.8047  ORF Transcript_3001/g.8047 Transcript_3001/m.8047 type:complete len:301 (+) Transcript_3001:150-1052(+)
MKSEPCLVASHDLLRRAHPLAVFAHVLSHALPPVLRAHGELLVARLVQRLDLVLVVPWFGFSLRLGPVTCRPLRGGVGGGFALLALRTLELREFTGEHGDDGTLVAARLELVVEGLELVRALDVEGGGEFLHVVLARVPDPPVGSRALLAESRLLLAQRLLLLLQLLLGVSLGRLGSLGGDGGGGGSFLGGFFGRFLRLALPRALGHLLRLPRLFILEPLLDGPRVLLLGVLHEPLDLVGVHLLGFRAFLLVLLLNLSSAPSVLRGFEIFLVLVGKLAPGLKLGPELVHLANLLVRGVRV